tara:strand:- start:24 stop:458 length:435 start_codon:yes stop_codon:yes gene_type:complete
MLRALVALATVHTAAGLHAVLTAAQGRDLARRWSPEYKFEMPKTHSAVGSVVKLRDVRRYVEVANILRDRVSDASNKPNLACVVQHTMFRGLTLFVLMRADDGGGDWSVMTQLPALDEDDDYQARSREEVVVWFQDLHEIAGEA